jgi:steroid delta-isomerase
MLTMPDRDAIETSIRAYAAAFAARDRAAWLGTFADDATQEDPIGEGTRRGREAIGAFWDGAMAAYPRLELVPRDIFVDGREAAMAWTINAQTAEAAIAFDGIDVFVFDDDARIVSVRAYWERSRIRVQE